MQEKIKIIHVQLLPIMSGVQKVTYDELINLSDRKYHKIVVCKSEGEFTEKLKSANIEVYLIPELGRSISLIKDLIALKKLYQFFKLENPDIVHTHSSKTGILGRIAAYFAKTPTIIHTVHGFAFSSAANMAVRLFYVILESIAAKVTTRIIVLNDKDAQIAAKILKAAPASIVTIPNGVDTELYAPTDLNNKKHLKKYVLKIDNDDLIVGMIGRLWYQKNPECFVRAAIKVLQMHKNVHFILVGDGELRAQLQEEIITSSFSDRINILGWRNDIPNILKCLDLMVLPSRWEGLPLSIIEAMSTGLPVVASDIAGNNHLVKPNITGLLFAPDDSTDLSTKILKLIENDDHRKQCALNSRSVCISEYNLHDRIGKLELLYEECVLNGY